MEKKIREMVKEAVKGRDEAKRDILRVVIGEIDRGNKREDSEWIRVMRKMIKNMEENIGYGRGDERMKREMEILGELMPRKMNREEIREYIKGNGIEILQKFGEGGNIGKVIKRMKEEGKEVEHGDIRAIVIEMMKENG